MISRTSWTADIRQAAQAVSIDPDLLEAQVIAESAGHPWAMNPEPKYPYLVDVATRRPFRKLTDAERVSPSPPADFRSLAGDPDQEWQGQRTSWGLLQVMGAVARERGFRGPYLSELCRVDTNLAIGAGIFAELLRLAQGDERLALATYNGGRGGARLSGPQAYAQKILAIRAGWRKAAPVSS